MTENLIALVQKAPETGDHTPLEALIIIGAIAIVALVVTTIISKRKK